jgi:hypothetical protein
MSKFFEFNFNVLKAVTAGVEKFRTSVPIVFCIIVVGVFGVNF